MAVRLKSDSVCYLTCLPPLPACARQPSAAKPQTPDIERRKKRLPVGQTHYYTPIYHTRPSFSGQACHLSYTIHPMINNSAVSQVDQS